jgi:hypothetical protein
MATTYLEITELPLETIEGFQHIFRVTARDAAGAPDPAGASIYFTSSDPAIQIYPTFPLSEFVGPAGTRLFPVRMGTAGPQTITVHSHVLGIISGTARTTVGVRPPGWGFDDKGLLPYGDATSGIGAALLKALAISTHEVDVTVTNLVQDNSPFLDGDALNPATWSIQRLDSNAFLNVVSVTQVGTYTYRLLCLEEFGPVTVTHRASSTTLKDAAGALLNTPRNVNFLGLLDATQLTPETRLDAHSSAVRDLANPQVPSQEWFAGTLQLTAAGDYQLESGKQLVRKLILRRLISTPGDFFHLPSYGIGFRVKQPIPAANLGALKTRIEKQLLQEPELEQVNVALTLASNGVLTVTVRAILQKTGEALQIGFKSSDQGLVLNG